MLKEKLNEKYVEIIELLKPQQLSIYACYGGNIFFRVPNGKTTVIKKENFVKTPFDKIILDVFNHKRVNVVLTINTKHVEYAESKGGIPIMLDDFSEIFGGKTEVVNNDRKEILRVLKKKRSVLVKGKFAILTARSLDEAGTMARILDKSAFVLSKVKKYVKLSEFVSRIETLVFINGYSKRNQQREWNLETTGKDVVENLVQSEQEQILSADKRNVVINVAKRIYAENITQGTWGNVSVRIDENDLYCTPKAVGYDLLKVQDMVRMNYHTNKQVSSGTPTSEKGIHCRIMRERSDAFIAVHAHPTYCSIFAARNQTLEVSPENRAVLGEFVYCSKHALPMTKRLANNTVDAMKGGKASFMGNHGVAVYGTDVEDVFNVLNTLEEECKKQIFAGK